MASKTLIISSVILVLVFLGVNTFLLNNFLGRETPESSDSAYNPQINPSDFMPKVDNKYLNFPEGKKFIYEGKTEEGIERIEVYSTGIIKNVMGVNVIEIRDKEYLNGELIEDTKDWFAQDKEGNIWYFGEDSKELIDGKVSSTEGSWVAGYYDAKPGIVMEANPKIGDIYRQEYSPGEAEDMGQVIALNVNVKTRYGEFTNCLQTKDWNPLENDQGEYKYYCPKVGNLVYEESIEDREGVQLIAIEGISKAAEPEKEPEPLKTQITEQEAIAIAKKEIDGKVTDVEIEKKFGRNCYVVEMDDDGKEIDVIIDINTGEVLGTED